MGWDVEYANTAAPECGIVPRKKDESKMSPPPRLVRRRRGLSLRGPWRTTGRKEGTLPSGDFNVDISLLMVSLA